MTDYINTLYAKADELASGSMKGGSRRAACAFIESLRGCSPEDAASALSAAMAATEGPYHDWLASLPDFEVAPPMIR